MSGATKQYQTYLPQIPRLWGGAIVPLHEVIKPYKVFCLQGGGVGSPFIPSQDIWKIQKILVGAEKLKNPTHLKNIFASRKTDHFEPGFGGEQ